MMRTMTDHRPWFRVWRTGVPKTVAPFPRQSVFNLLVDSAAGFPESTAIAFLGKHLSYRELLQEVERFSAVLAGLGVERGDRVGLLLPNSPQYVIAWYACQRLGAVAVGNNPLYTQRELAHQIKDHSPSVMVVLDQLYPAWAAVEKEVPVREVIVTKLTDYMRFPLNLLAPSSSGRTRSTRGSPGRRSRRTRASDGGSRRCGRPATPPPVAEVDAEHDVATLVYTGGTTGLSKGAMLSHFNIASNIRQVVPCITFFERGKDGVMCILPFFHSFGLVAMNFGIAQAGKLVLLPRFEVHMALKELDKEKPSFFPGVPRLFVALNEAPETAKYDLKSVKACISGAAPLPRAVAEKFHQVTGGANLVEGYGLTETSPVAHVNPFDKPKHGTIGLPIPDTDCRIVSLEDPDSEVPLGERGELCIKGPQVMLGYWNKPEATAEMIRGDWLHTGDIAIMDDEGFFQIVDRIKDMIIVSGFNVYPTEVEAVIYRHPKVMKACVVGLPDDTTGERVKAYVVAKEGETLTGEELEAWARDPAQGLTGYRVPKEWEFRDELPETLIGKVLRRVLQEEERKKASAAS